jgi:outer membrane lipoprotein-sorting protein
MQRGKPPGNFRWIRGVRSWQLDPERLRLQRIRSIIKSIQRDLDEGGRAHVRQIMKGPELYRIELERPDWSYNRTTILDRETLTAFLEATPESTVRSCMTFR